MPMLMDAEKVEYVSKQSRIIILLNTDFSDS